MCWECDIPERRIKRKEFRQDHGSGPEELPYRKKAKRKTRIPKHKHKWEIVYEWVRPWHPYDEISVQCSICKKWDYWRVS